MIATASRVTIEAILVYDIPPVIAAAGAIVAAWLSRSTGRQLKNGVETKLREVHDAVVDGAAGDKVQP